MIDFNYYTPTEVVFGKESEEKTARMVKKYGGTKVLVHFGGGSAQKSGLLDKVCDLLKADGIQYVTLGGVVSNPRLSKVQEGIDLCRMEGVDFILAIGGGSVIDSGKAIAYGVRYEGDVWDFYCRKAVPTSSLPLGAVLTIPAAGSEMSDSSVITNEDLNLKRGCNNDICRPKFAIMNPERSYTLPPYQTAAGVADIMMHTMERYFSHDGDMTVSDNMAEGLMRTVKESAFVVLKNPCDYRNRAQIMWAGSLAHNGLTGCGRLGDWATHQIGHELSALFDATHGAALTAVWPSWARYVMKEDVQRFVRFAVNVLDVNNDYTDPHGTALRGVEEMERFYRAIGMPVNIRELIGRSVTDDEIKLMARKCTRDYTMTQGHFKVLAADDIAEIYRMAN